MYDIVIYEMPFYEMSFYEMSFYEMYQRPAIAKMLEAIACCKDVSNNCLLQRC